jgi:hypothetical protein
MAVNSSLPETTTVVSGQILNKESNKGIRDLLVVLFDLDSWEDPENKSAPVITHATASVSNLPDLSVLYTLADRIGSEVTDDNGIFHFDITQRDFNLPSGREQKPDLLLLVLAPDEPGLDLNKRLLHFSKDIRLNAGSKEAYIIKLPSALLKEKGIPLTVETSETKETAESKVSLYINQKERELQYNTGLANYHGETANKETQDRKIFRQDFIRKVGTDYTVVPLNGQMVKEGDNVLDKNSETVNSGIAKANDALGDVNKDGVPVNLYLTPADKARLQPFFDNAVDGFVEIPDSEMGDILFRKNSSENPGTLLVHNNPIANFCSSKGEDEKCAMAHAGIPDGLEDGSTTPVTPTTTTEGPAVNEDIPKFIGRLLNNMPSPDLVMQPELSKKRADKGQVEKAVNDFSLQKGPAEVPAFYDFNSLQIAFDHVWKQLFDETIPNLAYTANTLGKSKFGVDSIVSNLLNNGLSLLNTFYAISPVEVPPVVAKLFDITKEEFNDMSYAIRDQLVNIATDINFRSGSTIQEMRVIQALTEQGERLIDSIRHDDYYTLHKTLRDLHDKLTGKYEFTVFAADKDYHSVNFGLMTTYRQQWTPLNYQAGKLIKTIPLSPKEERKYSLKVTRNEKRSSKEAKKNNTSITNEQNTVSRVEAEIMAKAQNKTTFNLSAEGDYDIGISSGKATTTFGVEAQNESSQNRKDARENTIKAVQDIKNELSSELTFEENTGNEYNESGTITNPNDELAVTYLFYELQKRYRLSEQIYRVMPVVMVAQEVPSPDQLTPAWVLSHDWIINRYLLDDSFRPVLTYLANNSVGDDFALRELRKNLRQQRNLVDTLRIEFSAASMEADNRYKALETAITKRIDEEHAERTDGLGNDIWDFFGGGGQDPEAAKARELAAKDAHQYAMEKAEKASAALRQEVNTLHNLTDYYNKTLQSRLDNETKVDRLLVHISKNIFYYMQAIWTMEPPDQRYLRLYKVQVPVLELESRSYRVKVQKEEDIFEKFREPGTEKHKALLHGKLKHNTNGNPFNYKPLVEVADLDTLLGFKGNYMIFPLKEHNALTEFMAAPYIDSAFGAMDPDELSNVNLDEYSKYICCLHDKLKPDEFEALKPQLKAWLEKLLATPLRNGDEIVVPTNSLFIEALVDENPILEDFKLMHRELDVFKVQEEVRKAGLENIRLAARLLNAEREDPDIEKKIIVEGHNGMVHVDVDNP